MAHRWTIFNNQHNSLPSSHKKLMIFSDSICLYFQWGLNSDDCVSFYSKFNQQLSRQNERHSTTIHLHRGKHRQRKINRPQDHPRVLSLISHPGRAASRVAKGGREGQHRSSRPLLRQTLTLGIHIPNLRLHESTQQMDRIQSHDREGSSDLRKIVTFRSLHFRSHHARHVNTRLSRTFSLLTILRSPCFHESNHRSCRSHLCSMRTINMWKTGQDPFSIRRRHYSSWLLEKDTRKTLDLAKLWKREPQALGRTKSFDFGQYTAYQPGKSCWDSRKLAQTT